MIQYISDPRSIYYNQYCSATVKGVLYVINDWPTITKFNGCGFEVVQNLPPPFSSGNPLCMEYKDKLLICIGTICGTYNPGETEIEFMPSLNDIRFGGTMILDKVHNVPMVFGGSTLEVFNVEDNVWKFIDAPADITNFSEFVQGFRIALGVDDQKIFMFARPDSLRNSKFYEYDMTSYTAAITESVPEPEWPSFTLDSVPMAYDSIGGNSYVIHHRPYNCADPESSDKLRYGIKKLKEKCSKNFLVNWLKNTLSLFKLIILSIVKLSFLPWYIMR